MIYLSSIKKTGYLSLKDTSIFSFKSRINKTRRRFIYPSLENQVILTGDGLSLLDQRDSYLSSKETNKKCFIVFDN